MIQELLGGGSATPNGLISERKINLPFPSSPLATTPILTPSSTTIPTSNTTPANNSSNGGNNNSSEANQNLRCPRCDSTNTKFCYYNNYNLTQPRHFCKTCRRYWTKGGTLRNVPIGGGCRKNKSTTSGASATSKSSSNVMAKAKATLSTEMLINGSPTFFPDLQATTNPAFWGQSSSSHILALLRGATQFANPSPMFSSNPNPNSNPMSSVLEAVKSENNTTLGLDSYGNGTSSLLGCFPRSNQLNGLGLGDLDMVQNGGNGGNMLDLYQRLKSSSNYNNYRGNENQGTVILGSVVGSSPSSSAMHSMGFEAASLGGYGGDGMSGYSMMASPGISSWSEYPTVPINGAYP